MEAGGRTPILAAGSLVVLLSEVARRDTSGAACDVDSPVADAVGKIPLAAARVAPNQGDVAHSVLEVHCSWRAVLEFRLVRIVTPVCVLAKPTFDSPMAVLESTEDAREWHSRSS
jgi:hypothetical protein